MHQVLLIIKVLRILFLTEKVNEAKKDAAEEKSEANYKAAKERCDSLSGAVKDTCQNDAKAKYGRK